MSDFSFSANERISQKLNPPETFPDTSRNRKSSLLWPVPAAAAAAAAAAGSLLYRFEGEGRKEFEMIIYTSTRGRKQPGGLPAALITGTTSTISQPTSLQHASRWFSYPAFWPYVPSAVPDQNKSVLQSIIGRQQSVVPVQRPFTDFEQTVRMSST